MGQTAPICSIYSSHFIFVQAERDPENPSDSDFNDDNEAPRIKKPLDPRMVLKRLEELDAEIKRFQTADDDLSSVRLHSLGGAPVHILPREVLTEIFTSCLPKWEQPLQYHIDQPDTLNRQYVPWILTQVCHDWRQVALSSPRLWTTIVIRPDKAHTEISVKILLLSTEILLRRSAKAPLYIRLQAMDHLHSMDNKKFQKHWMDLLEALMKHSERWQDIDFQLDPNYFRKLEAVKGHIPLVRKVRMQVLSEAYDRDVGKLDTFSHAPSLRHFEAYRTPKRPAVPWSQLTGYGGGINPSEQLDIICQTPSLVSFKLNITRVALPVLSTSVTFTHLRTLEVNGNPEILDYLTLPALEYLTLSYFRTAAPLISLISRSACSIKSIDFVIWGPTESDLMLVFQAMPAVTSATLVDFRDVITAELYTKLTAEPGSAQTCLLPRLEALDIQFPGRKTVSSGPYMKMLESRWRQIPGSLTYDTRVARLKRVRTHLYHRSVTTLPLELEVLRKEGFDSTVEFYH